MQHKPAIFFFFIYLFFFVCVWGGACLKSSIQDLHVLPATNIPKPIFHNIIKVAKNFPFQVKIWFQNRRARERRETSSVNTPGADNMNPRHSIETDTGDHTTLHREKNFHTGHSFLLRQNSLNGPSPWYKRYLSLSSHGACLNPFSYYNVYNANFTSENT